jgi:prepilin-type processing-associated H-X9-DG protein
MPETLPYAEPSTPAIPLDPDAKRSIAAALLFFLTPIPSVLAIRYGRRALHRLRAEGGRGRKHAWAGIVLGVAGLLAWAWAVGWVIDARRAMRQSMCMSNMRQLGLGLNMYAAAHRGALPDGWNEMLAAGLIRPENLVCPADEDSTVAPGATTQAVLQSLATGRHCSYVYVARGLTMQSMRGGAATTVVFYEPPGTHGERVVFGYADGHVAAVNRREAIALIQALHNRVPAPAPVRAPIPTTQIASPATRPRSQ